jgi:hypothetical protein
MKQVVISLTLFCSFAAFASSYPSVSCKLAYGNQISDSIFEVGQYNLDKCLKKASHISTEKMMNVFVTYTNTTTAVMVNGSVPDFCGNAGEKIMTTFSEGIMVEPLKQDFFSNPPCK